MSFLLIIIIVATNHKCLVQSLKTQVGGAISHSPNLQLKFSDIRNDISQGVPGSYSGYKNTHDSNPRRQRPLYNRNPVTIWGNQVPICKQTAPANFAGQDRIHSLSALQLKCSPECCPSPYSCDHGCVCYEIRKKPVSENHGY